MQLNDSKKDQVSMDALLTNQQMKNLSRLKVNLSCLHTFLLDNYCIILSNLYQLTT